MSKRNKEGDEALKKKLAKLRFKRLIRIAFVNHLWINETDDQGITLNVKKNVAMLVRKKHKTGILTMAQKGLLATLHSTRSIPERKKLCSIVAGLGCFTQVPPKIRARLVPHLHFMVVGAGRTLMKEGDIPTCVYFVVSGEVEMSKNILNKITRKIESKPEAFFGPGDWIGEVELLEEDLRMNTYKVTTNCEILVLDDFDFRDLLKPYVKKVWEEKKRAIASLSYLKFMSDSQIVSACKFGILRQYDPLSTIFPEKADNIQHVHFVLSGECVLLQCLRMTVTYDKGEARYELCPMVEEESENEDEDAPEPFDVRELLRSTSSLDEAGYNEKKAKRKAEFDKIEANCELVRQRQREQQELLHPTPQPRQMVNQPMVTPQEKFYHDYVDGEDYFEDYEDFVTSEGEQDFAHSPYRRSRRTFMSHISKLGSKMGSKMASRILNMEAEGEESEIFTASTPSISVNESMKSPKIIDDKNYSHHFVDVGSMTFGGLFGVGEKCDHRVVMARTTVQCLLIPRYWLMEEDQNQGHIWQRMRFYLDRCIPSRETLFQDFIKTRKWAQFKEECVEPFTHSTTSSTKIEDIPIILRIVETKESHIDATVH